MQEAAGEVVGHWKPNVTISIVKDFTAYPDPQIPPAVGSPSHLALSSEMRWCEHSSLPPSLTAFPSLQIRERMVLDPYSGNYYPPVWFNDFWLLREHLVPLNNTMDEVWRQALTSPCPPLHIPLPLLLPRWPRPPAH